MCEILYKDIPKYCYAIDRDKKSTVIMSEVQGKLYKKLLNDPYKPTSRIYVIEFLFHTIFLIYISFFYRNLLLLGYFHRHGYEMVSKIKFEKKDNRVYVTFNSGATGNELKESTK